MNRVLRSGLSSFALVAITNLPFWCVSYYMTLARPVFNLDSVVSLIISRYSVAAGVISYLLALIADMVTLVYKSYHFNSFTGFVKDRDVLWILEFKRYIAPSLGVLIFMVVSLYIFHRLRQAVCISKAGLLSVSFFLLLGDMYNGSFNSVAVSDKRISSYNIAGSQVFPIFREVVSKITENERNSSSASFRQVRGVLNELDIVKLAITLNANVLFIVVESLGSPKSAALDSVLSKSLYPDSLQSRYLLKKGLVPFVGATAPGELRSLCGLAGNPIQLSNEMGKRCLPGRFSDLGWNTTGYHGFTGKMYSRDLWWGTIGLRNIYLGGSLSHYNLNQCGGGFRGPCDSEILRLISDRELVTTNNFVYFLTLETHLPLEVVAVDEERCQNMMNAGEISDISACALVIKHEHFLSNVANLASNTMNPLLVVVVGDHAPPFIRKGSRNSFVYDQVPYYILIPRI